MLLQFLMCQQCHFEIPHPILVCTYTNAAVDNLLEGMVGLKDSTPKRRKISPLKPLRVTFGSNVKDSLYRYTLDAQVDQHPRKPVLDEMQKRLEDCVTRLTGLKALLASTLDELKTSSTNRRLLTKRGML